MCRHIGKDGKTRRPQTVRTSDPDDCTYATNVRSKLLGHCTLGATMQVRFVERVTYFKILSKEYQKLRNTVKNQTGTTVQNKQKRICNQVQRCQMTRRQFTKNLQTHTGGLSENCLRLQFPSRHHFGDKQSYLAVLGDEPSQLKEHHVAHCWRLELHIPAALIHCLFCATHLFADFRVCVCLFSHADAGRGEPMCVATIC